MLDTDIDVSEVVNLISCLASSTSFIVQYLGINGFLKTQKLFESPFTEVSAHSLLGVFNQAQASEAVLMVERVNQYAEAV